MRISRLVILLMAVMVSRAAMADGSEPGSKGPFAKLREQIEALNDRIEVLEANAPTSDVEGRDYCMMVNIDIYRGWSNTATEETQTFIARRLATFSGGAFTATLIDGMDIRQDDNGVVSAGFPAEPDTLTGVYTQTGQRLDLVLDSGEARVWYASADGSVIHAKSADHFGPFPNSISVGVVRNATLIESDTCDGV